MSETLAQHQVCKRFGAPFAPSAPNLTVGLAIGTLASATIQNGLRHAPVGHTTGWFIWAGEVLSSDDDFFATIHVSHLIDYCPSVLPYLGLPPGWRFLIADGYEDVWFDPTLLDAS